MHKSLFILFLMLLCLLAACTGGYRPGDIVNTNPQTFFSDEYSPRPTDGILETETDYSQITAFSEQESYPRNAEVFTVWIKNPSGKAFYLYSTSFLEKKSGNAWKRLNHQSPSMQSEFGWVQASDGELNLDVRPEDVRQKLKTGEYRFVVFVGNEVLYAPFSLTKE